MDFVEAVWVGFAVWAVVFAAFTIYLMMDK
jgi:hypothetical protein